MIQRADADAVYDFYRFGLVHGQCPLDIHKHTDVDKASHSDSRQVIESPMVNYIEIKGLHGYPSPRNLEFGLFIENY